MALFGHFSAGLGENSIFYFAEFDFKLPISGVVFRIRRRLGYIDVGIVKAGPHLSGKKKRPGHADGADGIEFVRVEENLGFDRFRPDASPKAMGPNTVKDVFLLGSREIEIGDDGNRQFRSFYGMTHGSLGRILVSPTDIVKVGSDEENRLIGRFGASDTPAKPCDAKGMLPVMATPSAGKEGFGDG